jgi:hypothetical protein
MGLDWLDSVESIVERWEAAGKAFEGGRKGRVTVWGPSQSGKSTLLSESIDGEFDSDGSLSALTWTADSKTRFSLRDAAAAELYPDTVILNPFRFGSDASGVVTRYSMREDYELAGHASHPVEITLAGEAQIMHAIAAGYLYECEPLLSDGRSRCWERHHLEKLASDMPGKENQPSPESFKLLRDAFHVVESMLKAGERRFSNLDANGDWSASLRKRLLLNEALSGSPQNALDFVRALLWDSHDCLNSLHDETRERMAGLRTKWDGARVFCSMRAASLILDIGSFGDARLRGAVDKLGWRRDGDRILIDCGGAASPEISGDRFGVFQALVGELCVPIKKSVVEAKGGAFFDFMSGNDLLDFPGVPQRDQAAREARMDLSKIKGGDPALLVRLFKRGKTLSMVASHAREMSIDAFLILARADRPVAKPGMINAGLEQWLRHFDPDFEGLAALARPPLPIHVNLTFFAAALNQAAMAGAGNIGEVALRLDDLGEIAKPGKAFFHLTTYKHLPGGGLDDNLKLDASKRGALRRDILGNADFVKRLPGAEDCVRAVLEDDDGGTGLLLRRLGQTDRGRRFELYRSAARKDHEKLLRLLSDNLPDDSGLSARRMRETISAAAAAVSGALSSWGNDERVLAELGNGIKHLCSISPDIFESLPRERNHAPYTVYVSRHLEKWCSEKMESSAEFMSARLMLSDAPSMRGFLDAVSASCDARELTALIYELAGSGPGCYCLDLADLRTPLASAFSNAVLYGRANRESPHREENRAVLRTDENVSRLAQAPHYVMLIEPFLKRLESAQNAGPQTRPPQKGDTELEGIRTLEFYSFMNN